MNRLKMSLFMLLLVLGGLLPQQSRADEPFPPFFFKLTPAYQEGKINYDLRLASLVEWKMVDIAINIGLPSGSRYVKAEAPATTSVQFDGNKVLFFTSVFHKPIRGGLLQIEPLDSQQTVFTAPVTITWQGEHPGSYQTEVAFDITKKPLNWDRPQLPLEVGFMATVNNDDTITYNIYPQSFSGLRMWDLRLNIALPSGTTFVSAENPPQFGYTFDGAVVYFLASEMPRDTVLQPLRVKVSTANAPDNQPLTTHVWASWKNAGFGVGEWIVAEENFNTGDIQVMPRVPQYAVADMAGDVPLSNYDLTSLNLQDMGSSVQLRLKLAAPIRATEPLIYQFFIDSDCQANTGFQRDGRGMDYRVRFNNVSGKTDLMPFDSAQNDWATSAVKLLNYEITASVLTISLPYNLMGDNKQFCWSAILRNDTQEYTPDPLPERVPDSLDPRLTQYLSPGQSELATLLDEAVKGKEVIVIPLMTTTVEAKPKPRITATTTMPAEAKPNNNTPTPPPSNESEFILLGDEWQYQLGWSQPLTDWIELAFDDTTWATGRTPLGYGDGQFVTDLSVVLASLPPPSPPNLEQGNNAPKVLLNAPPQRNFNSFYMRHRFTLQKVSQITRLILRLDYEDGFVAYLNGVEVARRGLKSPGTPLLFNTPATDREGGEIERIDLTSFINKLVEGDNILALEVHRSLGRSNLYAAPELRWQRPGKPIPTPTPTLTPTLQVSQTKPSTPTVTPTRQPASTPVITATIPVSPTQVTTPTALAVVATATPIPMPTATPMPTVEVNTLPPLPTVSAPAVDYPRPNTNPSIIDTQGKIAIPLDDGKGFYNTHIFTVRFGYGWESDLIAHAHQPDFSADGQRLLFNRDGGDVANIMEYDFATKKERNVSDNPLDANPAYDVTGTRVVYDNPALDIDPDGRAYSHIVVQCSLLPPGLETDPRCRDVAVFGILIPSGQMGRIEGSHPVWGSNDMIIYQGCDSWVGGATCGIYAVGSWSTKGRGNGEIPTRLTDNPSDIPTDTHAYHTVFMSQREGNWEVYVMGLAGDNQINLSNNPGANDGLPALSPDGSWVAFISDRDGRWAAWAVPLVGGTPQKLFDLPTFTPWGSQERSWSNERISWGP